MVTKIYTEVWEGWDARIVGEIGASGCRKFSLNLAFVATKICLSSILFSKSTREVFTDKVALSKQVCLWFTDAAIPYYNPPPPPPPSERACAGLGQGNRSQCPVQSNKSGDTLDIYTCT